MVSTFAQQFQPMLEQMVDTAVSKYIQKTQNDPQSANNNSNLAKTMRKQSRQQIYNLDRVEQTEKKNDIKIRGIEYVGDEDTAQIVVDLASKVQVDIKKEDFTCYRLGKPEKSSRPILVKLHNQHKKIELMRAKKNLATAAAGKFIEEDLTRLRSKLYFEVRHNENTTKDRTIEWWW